MKLLPKLTIALVAVMSIILAVNGSLRVRRETRHYETERRREHDAIARSLGVAVAGVWSSQGRAPAMQAIDDVNRHITNIDIRWLDDGNGATVSAAEIAVARPGEPIFKVVRGETSHWYTYVVVDVGGVRRGAIELSEEPANELEFARRNIIDTIESAAALAILAAILAYVLGRWLVGVPVGSLTAKARRIARGDFSGPLELARRDEFGELAEELNRMCERLTRTIDQLRHADRLATVGKLASGIAHELGTPLNVVSARAEMIAQGDTSAIESQAYAKAIGAAAERMTGIIRQLMQFARRSGPAQSVGDVRRIAADAVALLEPLASKRKVRVALTASTSDVRANVDAGQLQQVVTNLVMNAVQALKDGGDVHVTCELVEAEPPADVVAADGSYVCLRVDDDGPGMTEEIVARVFEPFFTTKGVGEGTGLGLAVSYGIVRDHGGWMRAESSPGRGSSFFVYLPGLPS